MACATAIGPAIRSIAGPIFIIGVWPKPPISGFPNGMARWWPMGLVRADGSPLAGPLRYYQDFGSEYRGRASGPTQHRAGYRIASPVFQRAGKRSFFVSGELCEKFRFSKRLYLGLIPTKQITIKQPAFMHFKWAKSVLTATQAWPTNWKEIPVFHERIGRRENLGPSIKASILR